MGSNFFQILNKPSKLCPRLLKLCQSGKISLNPVTLLNSPSFLCSSWKTCSVSILLHSCPSLINSSWAVADLTFLFFLKSSRIRSLKRGGWILDIMRMTVWPNVRRVGQRILTKGEVSLYSWPPVYFVWIRFLCLRWIETVLLVCSNPYQSHSRSALQGYLPLW